MQLFGEYLHVLEDTFGHRNQRNEPIALNKGLGHGIYGVEPDKTYNDKEWIFRENRTLEMEREVFNKIQSQFGSSAAPPGKFPITFGDIEMALRDFNSTRESEETSGLLFQNSLKIGFLNRVLLQHGYRAIPEYNVKLACENRKTNLKGLGVQFTSFHGDSVILETPEVCVEKRAARGK